jgi:hypothetical protein
VRKRLDGALVKRQSLKPCVHLTFKRGGELCSLAWHTLGGLTALVTSRVGKSQRRRHETNALRSLVAGQPSAHKLNQFICGGLRIRLERAVGVYGFALFVVSLTKNDLFSQSGVFEQTCFAYPCNPRVRITSGQARSASRCLFTPVVIFKHESAARDR